MCIRDRNISFVRLNAKDFGIVKEAVITGVPMLVFMATNFVKALGLNTIIMNQIGEDGMAVFTVCDNVLPVSYTHLDVYKRQPSPIKVMASAAVAGIALYGIAI